MYVVVFVGRFAVYFVSLFSDFISRVSRKGKELLVSFS